MPSDRQEVKATKQGRRCHLLRRSIPITMNCVAVKVASEPTLLLVAERRMRAVGGLLALRRLRPDGFACNGQAVLAPILVRPEIQDLVKIDHAFPASRRDRSSKKARSSDSFGDLDSLVLMPAVSSTP